MTFFHSLGRAALGAAAALSLGLTSSAASAGGDADLTDWKERTGALVSQSMTYPNTRFALADGRNVVELLVGRDGKIESAQITRWSNRHYNRETERFLERVDRLPALPATVAGERALVKIHMIYAATNAGVQRLSKDAARETRQEGPARIASADTVFIELAAVK